MVHSSVITATVHARPSRVPGDVISAKVLCERLATSSARLKSGEMQFASEGLPALCCRLTDLATRLA